jgi:hypothetical protein
VGGEPGNCGGSGVGEEAGGHGRTVYRVQGLGVRAQGLGFLNLGIASSFSGVRLGRLANEPDQKHDHPILVPVIYVWKTVLARNADITLRILPWVFAVVPAGIPVVERWRQELDLTGITPYCLYLPPAYLTFGFNFP